MGRKYNPAMTNERRLPDGRVELTDTARIEASSLYNEDLAPVPLATVIDRPVFDRALADRAIAAGAEIRGAARVTALDVDAVGVHASVGGATVHARLAVLACGGQEWPPHKMEPQRSNPRTIRSNCPSISDSRSTHGK